jgi:hypothetical protein
MVNPYAKLRAQISKDFRPYMEHVWTGQTGKSTVRKQWVINPNVGVTKKTKEDWEKAQKALGRRAEAGYFYGKIPTRRWRKRIAYIKDIAKRGIKPRGTLSNVEKQIYSAHAKPKIAKVVVDYAPYRRQLSNYEKQVLAVKGPAALKRSQLGLPRIQRLKLTRARRAFETKRQAELARIRKVRVQLK